MCGSACLRLPVRAILFLARVSRAFLFHLRRDPSCTYVKTAVRAFSSCHDAVACSCMAFSGLCVIGPETLCSIVLFVWDMPPRGPCELEYSTLPLFQCEVLFLHQSYIKTHWYETHVNRTYIYGIHMHGSHTLCVLV
jgi:hypothetical protein